MARTRAASPWQMRARHHLHLFVSRACAARHWSEVSRFVTTHKPDGREAREEVVVIPEGEVCQQRWLCEATLKDLRGAVEGLWYEVRREREAAQ